MILMTTGFRAMYHLTQSKNGVSALELMRRFGVSYNAAWKLKHKLMQVMKGCEAPIQWFSRHGTTVGLCFAQNAT